MKWIAVGLAWFTLLGVTACDNVTDMTLQSGETNRQDTLHLSILDIPYMMSRFEITDAEYVIWLDGQLHVEPPQLGVVHPVPDSMRLETTTQGDYRLFWTPRKIPWPNSDTLIVSITDGCANRPPGYLNGWPIFKVGSRWRYERTTYSSQIFVPATYYTGEVELEVTNRTCGSEYAEFTMSLVETGVFTGDGIEGERPSEGKTAVVVGTLTAETMTFPPLVTAPVRIPAGLSQLFDTTWTVPIRSPLNPGLYFPERYTVTMDPVLGVESFRMTYGSNRSARREEYRLIEFIPPPRPESN